MSPPSLSLAEQSTSTQQLGLVYAESSGHTVPEKSIHPQRIPEIPLEAEKHVKALLKYPVDWALRWLETAHLTQNSTSGQLYNGLSLALSEVGQPSTTDDKAEPLCEDSSHSNTYWCTYCDRSFGLKGVWKRHEENFHEPQRKWKCPSGCGRTFSAKNKFVSHHKNDHGCHKCGCGDSAKVEVLPRKIAWGCGFCSRLLLTWDGRCDHIASHFEGSPEYPKMTKQDWDHSKVIEGLLSQPKIDEAWRCFLRKMDGASAEAGREFNWDPKSTRELVQRLEYRENQHDLFNIVESAYVLGSACRGYYPVPSSILLPEIPSGFITPTSRSTVNESSLDSSYCHSALPSTSATHIDYLEQKSIDCDNARLPGTRSEESPANVSSQAVIETQVIQNFLQNPTDSQDDPDYYPGYGQYGPWASPDDQVLYAHWDTAHVGGVTMFPPSAPQ